MKSPPVSDTQPSETVPQAATNLLAISIKALLGAALRMSVGEWLKAHTDLSASARRQVSSILLFIGLLGESEQLSAEVGRWRSDPGLLAEALIRRFRDAYAAAGCHCDHAELIGNPLLTGEAVARVLEAEPPFRRLGNPETRGNAIRFARRLHEMIVDGTLFGQNPAVVDRGSRPGNNIDRNPGEVDPAPVALHDLGTTINPKRYRVARVQDDVWVYGLVCFEHPGGPAGPGWRSAPDPAEQSRWLEQLAAALLQDADAMRPREPGNHEPHRTFPP
jgi:hypothetical protein